MTDQRPPINGLMDGARAAHFCGITDNSWRSWKKRHLDGKGGAAKFFPKPVTDFAGVDVYLETDVMRFRDRLAKVTRGRPPRQDDAA